MKRKLIALLLTVAMCLSTSVSLFVSATELRDITIHKGVNIYVDGKIITPVDVNGNEVEPFLYNGTTYLPVRAVSGIFGAGISWDSSERTVTVTSGGAAVSIPHSNKPVTSSSEAKVSAATDAKIIIDGKNFIPTDVNGVAVPVLIINGTTYLPARAISNLFSINITWDSKNFSVYMGKIPDAEALRIEAAELISSISSDLNDFELIYTNVLAAKYIYTDMLKLYLAALAASSGDVYIAYLMLYNQLSSILVYIMDVTDGKDPEHFETRFEACKNTLGSISTDSDLSVLRTLRTDLTNSLSTAKFAYTYCTSELIAYYYSMLPTP